MEDKEDLKALKITIFASIISADNGEYTEEVKQEILQRWHDNIGSGPLDWNVILEPLGGDKYKYLEILTK